MPSDLGLSRVKVLVGIVRCCRVLVLSGAARARIEVRLLDSRARACPGT